MSDKSASAAARGAWMASGITFFAVGVVFSLTMPDNIALGITFLGLGVVFFSLAGTKRAPGDGPAEPAADEQTEPPANGPADPPTESPDPGHSPGDDSPTDHRPSRDS